jgi:tetratricopeptide (TPR) repeat protein
MATEAIERLKEKLDKDPNSKLFVPLAEEYKKAGMFEEAIEVLTKGLEKQPTYLSARVSLGKIYIERGMPDAAKTEFEKVIAVIPDNLYAHKKLAEIHKDLGEKDDSIRELKTVLRLNPTDEWAAASLSEIEKEAAPAPPDRSAEEIMPVTEEYPETPQAVEEKPLEAARERLPDAALTARDLELSKILPEEGGQEPLQEIAEAEIQPAWGEKELWGAPPEPTEKIEEEPLDMPFGKEEEELFETPFEPEEIAEEEPLDIPFGKKEEELWGVASESEEPMEQERETPPKTAISKEDMDLWKTHLETVEETSEKGEGEPLIELDELAEEESIPFQDIFQEPEPVVRGAIAKEPEPTLAAQQAAAQGLEDADKWILQEKFGEAMKIYRTMLSADPDNKRVHQRIEELRSLLKLLGKDKEELVAKLEHLLEGIKKRRDEFSGTA